ncbi:MAG: 2-O-(6-phospho-alpha-D-mannosyl)-D-glycerate hydrolase [Chloroflexota bacterium]|nr:2-O-(6-phospho-alpha-D-mannosyl)-D-glycerate hydrolase [Chloroflexota bacterium]
MASPTTVHLVPHTHWDREWYLPFQAFRMRLVGLLDDLLDAMEKDDRLRFTLDGQLATVDDYLEIRPGAEPRIAALVRAGRLAVGPWLILMDEFLVSGETIVRNLQLGTRRAAELGRVMEVGYLPDMFGHIAQMPQILRRAGIVDAVVWRGVPEKIDRHAFTWRSPDGSAVRGEYLRGGYGNARDVFDDPQRIESKLGTYVAEVRELFGGDDVLAMYGEDHSIPLQGYADLVDGFNRQQDRFRVRVATLGDYLAATRDGSPTERSWDGELRSGAHANILMGVVSNHVDVRAAAAMAERLVYRTAEPLAALHGATWPERYLELAVRRIVENSAHDSICACSLDPVVAQVLVRFAEASQIAAGLAGATLGSWATGLERGAWAVFNPSPTARADLVEIELPAEGPAADRALVDATGRPVASQEIGRGQRIFDEREIESRAVPAYLTRRIHGRELYARQINGWSLAGPERRELTIHVDRVPDPPILDVDAMVAEIAQAAAADPGQRWRLRVVESARRTVVALVEAPALGLASVAATGSGAAAGAGSAAAGIAATPAAAASVSARPVVGTERTIDNGLLAVAIAADGTLTLTADGTHAAGIGRLVDGGDVGDTYNYAPPSVDVAVDRPSAVEIRAVEPGPLRAVTEVVRRYAWPAGLSADLTTRRTETVEVEVVTRLELRAGEPFLRLSLTYDNRAVDHRLRFHLPLPRPAQRSYAEGQFAVVERGLTAEGGHGEVPLPTQPADTFVAAGGIAVLPEHIVEYELVDEGRELAVTMLRATGLISRDDHPYRDEPAGPVLATPGAQLPGPRTFAFAILPYAAEVPGSDVLAAAEAYRHPFLLAPGTGPAGALPPDRSGLAIEGEGVVLSSLRRREDMLEIRIVAERPTAGRVTVRGAFDAAREVDLLGRPGASLAVTGGVLELELGPWEIRTVQLRPSRPS